MDTERSFNWLYPSAGSTCPVCRSMYDPHKVQEWGGLLCLTCWTRSSAEFRSKIQERLSTVSSYSMIPLSWVTDNYEKKEE